MKLSIYVNLRSIGWLVSDGDKVVAKGIKRVMVDFDNYYEYFAGLPVSKRINRREKRSARKNRWRYQSRRKALTDYLAKKGMKVSRNYSLKEMLELRVRALTEKVSNSELASIFLSLQKKRGYKNMRGLANSESSEYLATIKMHEENASQYRSISEYLLNNFASIKNIIFLRESYEKEFNLICEAQGISDKKLFDLIYFQRALKRGAIGNCPLETNRKVCHYSHPNYQKFRIWRDVMNIHILDENFDEVEISFEHRKKWFEKLFNCEIKTLTKAACCKDLGIKKAAGYSWKSGKAIANNLTNISVELWQDLFSATEDHQLLELLRKKYPNENHDELMDLNLAAAGWGDYSHKAITTLTDLMAQGMTLKEAILHHYGVVDFGADVCLRNLIVEQHYDSYTSLLGKLKKKYDIKEVAVGINSLLTAGNKARKAMAKARRTEAKRSNEYSDYQYALLALWEESGGFSPYEPNKQISKEELFENYNIDHIIPKSKLFEFGKSNQVLCRKDLNEQKASKTGLEFAIELGIESDYRKFIDNSKFSETKKKYCLMLTEMIPTNIFDSVDYISRCFLTQANYIIPNRIIHKYYKYWELNNYADNDVRNSLQKAVVVANFDTNKINYFNNLKVHPTNTCSRYNLGQCIVADVSAVIPYIPRVKFYRKTKDGIIPRFKLHDESNYGKRKGIVKDKKGKPTVEYYYSIRKPVASLTAPMIDKIIDKGLQRKFKAFFDGKDHKDAITELLGNPIIHNNYKVRSVAIRVNATDLIKLDRGYVWSAMNHRLNLETMQTTTLHKYISDLNSKEKFTGKYLKMNDIIEYDGNYYFVIGAADASGMNLRSVYELDAISTRSKKRLLQASKIIRVNEIGEINEHPPHSQGFSLCFEDN